MPPSPDVNTLLGYKEKPPKIPNEPHLIFELYLDEKPCAESSKI